MKIQLNLDRVIKENGKDVSYKKGDIVEMDARRAAQYRLTGAGKNATLRKKKSERA